jgi:hypothetical protein
MVGFYPAPVSERLQLVRCTHTRRGTGLRPRNDPNSMKGASPHERPV